MEDLAVRNTNTPVYLTLDAVRIGRENGVTAVSANNRALVRGLDDPEARISSHCANLMVVFHGPDDADDRVLYNQQELTADDFTEEYDKNVYAIGKTVVDINVGPAWNVTSPEAADQALLQLQAPARRWRQAVALGSSVVGGLATLYNARHSGDVESALGAFGSFAGVVTAATCLKSLFLMRCWRKLHAPTADDFIKVEKVPPPKVSLVKEYSAS